MSSLFSFKGKYTRSDWWMAETILYFLTLATSLLWGIVAYKTITTTPNIEINYFLLWTVFINASIKMQVALLILTTATTWIWFASMVKRFRDRGKSGLWAFIYFVPYVGPLIAWIECGLIVGKPDRNENDDSSLNHLNVRSYEGNNFIQEEKPQTRKAILSKNNFAEKSKKPKPLFGA